jgi:S1-C subfamily serine protease
VVGASRQIVNTQTMFRFILRGRVLLAFGVPLAAIAVRGVSVNDDPPKHAPFTAAENGDPPSANRYDTLGEMVEDVFPSLVKVGGTILGKRIASGCGFIISEDGLVVTNKHVISSLSRVGCTHFVAAFDDGRAYTLENVADDEESDIAVCRIIAPPGTRFKAMALGSAADSE